MPVLRAAQAVISIGDQCVSSLVEGLGVNWCDAFGMGGERGLGRRNTPLNTPCIPMLDDARNWKLLLEELTALKVSCLRFMLPPDGFITKRGTMDFDCAHFQRLERLHEWARANGATLFLDTMYVPRHLQAKGVDGAGEALDNRAAANPEEFAEHFAGPLLDYCLSERNWTQIRYYSPINTPLYAGIYHHPQGDSFRAYAGLMASLRKELLDRGLVPQRVSLVGPGSPSIPDWAIPDLHARGLDLDPLVDAYDQHSFCARPDDAPPNANAQSLPMTELIERHLEPHAAFARAKGKALLITELGHAYYGASRGDLNGPATHAAFMLDAEFIVRAINAGVQGLLRWSFLNPGDINGRWQMLDCAGGTYKRSANTFYGYANLIRYARPHSDVLNVSVESSLHPWPHLYVCALRKTQGGLTLLAVNNHASEQIEAVFKLTPGMRQKALNVVRTDRILKHALVGELKREGKGAGTFSDRLPPCSVTAYTTLEYDPLRL